MHFGCFLCVSSWMTREKLPCSKFILCQSIWNYFPRCRVLGLHFYFSSAAWTDIAYASGIFFFFFATHNIVWIHSLNFFFFRRLLHLLYVCTSPFVCHNWYMFVLSHNRRAFHRVMNLENIDTCDCWCVHGRYCCAFSPTYIFRYHIANKNFIKCYLFQEFFFNRCG